MALQNSTSSRAIARYPVYRVIAAILAGLVASLLVLSSNDALHQALHSQAAAWTPVHGTNQGDPPHRCSHHHGHRSSPEVTKDLGTANKLPGESPVDHQEGCAICLFASAVIDEVQSAICSTITPRTLAPMEWPLSSTDPLASSEAPPSERGPPGRDFVAA